MSGAFGTESPADEVLGGVDLAVRGILFTEGAKPLWAKTEDLIGGRL